MNTTHYSITPRGQDVPPGHLVFHRVAVKGLKPRKKVKAWVKQQQMSGRWPTGVYIQRIPGKYAPHQPEFDNDEIYEYPKVE